MTIDFSICILTYNRCCSVVALLEEVSSLIDDSTEVIVVDNHSDDATKCVVPVNFLKVRYFRTDENIGAAGRNVAFENARGKIIVCLDDDVFGMTRNSLAEIYKKFKSNPKLGVINFKVLNAFNGKLCNWVHHCSPDIYQDKEFPTYEITEGAVAFRKEVLYKSGFYDPIYFISHEGPDLAFRILRCGYDCIYSGDIIVTHCHEQTGRASWLNYYYDTRNHIFLAVKNLPFIFAAKYLFIGILSMMVYSLRDGYFAYWCKAMKDGIKSLPELVEKRDCLPDDVIKVIKQIDRNKEPFIYKVRSRLFKSSARL
jgi:GT2 family glycosyltransferase